MEQVLGKGVEMVTERLTEMSAQEFEQLIDNFIERETKDMGELDSALFYSALEEIYAAKSQPTTVELQAQIIGSELHLYLPTSTPTDIVVHDNIIDVNNLRFVIQLVKTDELTA